MEKSICHVSFLPFSFILHPAHADRPVFVLSFKYLHFYMLEGTGNFYCTIIRISTKWDFSHQREYRY
jgi:hypothetical protein